MIDLQTIFKKQAEKIEFQKLSQVTSEQLISCIDKIAMKGNEVLNPIFEKFNITKDQELKFIEITKYFFGFESEYKQKKGICLGGEIGCGKNILFEAICSALAIEKAIHKNKQCRAAFKRVTAIGLEGIYRKTGDQGLEAYLIGPLCIHDLGLDEGVVTNYGSRLNVIQYILSERYDLWQKTGTPTYTTSNMDDIMFSKMYGERLSGRYKEMNHWVLLPGGDRRKNK